MRLIKKLKRKYKLADASKMCCIVIPVYKKIPSDVELASLKQALNILHSYPFYFICAEEFDFVFYSDILQLFPNISYAVKRFKNDYFSSINGYNSLLISYFFYKAFADYKYLLIYQLDAWVFYDALLEWCNQEYDYIGAPWYDNYNTKDNLSAKFSGVGNGGFSLRKIKSNLKVLSSFHYVTSPNKLWNAFKEKPSMGNLIWLIKNLTINNNTFYLFNSYDFQEDYFWGRIATSKFKWYVVPNENIAAKFSIEVNEQLLFAINDYKLPFGCHAWGKYNYKFWIQYIDMNGV